MPRTRPARARRGRAPGSTGFRSRAEPRAKLQLEINNKWFKLQVPTVWVDTQDQPLEDS